MLCIHHCNSKATLPGCARFRAAMCASISAWLRRCRARIIAATRQRIHVFAQIKATIAQHDNVVSLERATQPCYARINARMLVVLTEASPL